MIYIYLLAMKAPCNSFYYAISEAAIKSEVA